jgi:hypothetical protein
MTGREAMLLQISPKAVSGEFRAGGSSTSRQCGHVDRYRTLARFSFLIAPVELNDGQQSG